MTTTIIQKIFALKLSALLNGQHFNFMKFVATAIGMFQVIGERFAQAVEVFMQAFEREDDVYQKYDRKRATKLISDASIERDEKFRILRDSIKIAQRMTDAAVRNAADILMGIIDLYGGTKIPGMGMDEKSGVLTNMVQDLEDKHATEISTLNIGGLLAELKTANNEFIRLVSDRTLSDSEFGKQAMRDARTDTDKAYRSLIETINLEVFYGRGAELAPFNNYMNTEISRYRILTGQGVPGSTSTGSGSGSEEDGVLFKNITFVYVGGTELKLRIEVGTPIIPPVNTEGYVWPDLPELMPKRSFTVREVPIEEAMATATFHFFDHREEELRQLVGSILHAPDNTTGYYWDPEVPETMPAEDTNYYELPISVELSPEDGVTVVFKLGSETLYQFVVPVDGQISEEDFPEPPEGYHWNFTLAQINLSIPAKNPGDTITVRAQAD